MGRVSIIANDVGTVLVKRGADETDVEDAVAAGRLGVELSRCDLASCFAVFDKLQRLIGAVHLNLLHASDDHATVDFHQLLRRLQRPARRVPPLGVAHRRVVLKGGQLTRVSERDTSTPLTSVCVFAKMHFFGVHCPEALP